MEIFKDIPWYEWLYQASNLWNIKSLSRIKDLYWWRKQKTTEKIMKQEVRNNWYRMVGLYKSDSCTRIYVHRLVCMTFLDNPESKQEVNHKNAVRDDNRLENLEWSTRWENQHHKHILWYRNNFQKNPPNLWKFWKDNKDSKSVIQLSLSWEFIRRWDALMDIQRELWYSVGNISSVCNWTRPTANWFKWKYE